MSHLHQTLWIAGASGLIGRALVQALLPQVPDAPLFDPAKWWVWALIFALMGGMGYLAYLSAWERIYHLCGGRRWLAQFAISHWAFGPSAVLERVTDRARAEVLPGMMAGETMMCFGMSEPDAGSDATMIRTRAEPDGDGWRLYGRKIWTTHFNCTRCLSTRPKPPLPPCPANKLT